MSELRIASTKPGSKPRVLIPASPQNEYVQPAAWSRDGRLLARIWKNDGTVQIAWISVRDGSVSVLRSLWQRSPGRPTLSPDGKYIAYSALATESVRSINPAPEGNSHIYVLATNGGPETEVVGGNSSNEGPVWSADGNHILFSSNRKNGEFGLWSVPVREGKPGDPPELLKPGTGRLIPIGLTSSGSLYFANRQREGDEAFVIQFSEPDGKIYGPSSPLTENFVGTNRGVSWSPDGEFIAFKRERATKKGTFDVVVRNVASREERTYSTSLFEIGPEATNWFQDSKGLVQYDSAGTYYRLDLMSGEFRKIATGSSQLSYGTAAIPSPDNNVLYVTASDSAIKGLGFNRIVAFDLKAGLERSVFTSSEVFGTFALSPDGRTLAIMSANTGGGSKWINGRFLMQMGSPQPVRLSVVGIDGTGYRLLYGPFPILENPSSNALVWTRDGRSVLFGMSHPDRPLVTQVMRLSIQGGEPRYTGLDIRGPFHYVSLAPGNASIAFSETLQDRWRLSAVDNVFPSRKLP
jgi:Tol biopolymer transport system component